VISSEQLNQEQELQKSLDKIVKNVDASNQALAQHLEHVNELKVMLQTQDDGPVKEELVRVLTNAEKHVHDLDDHVKFGQKLVAQKETKLFDLQKQLGHKLDKPRSFADIKMPDRSNTDTNSLTDRKATAAVAETSNTQSGSAIV
jgi:hypothetical protein